MDTFTIEDCALTAAVCKRYRQTAVYLESLGINTPPVELAAVAALEAKAATTARDRAQATVDAEAKRLQAAETVQTGDPEPIKLPADPSKPIVREHVDAG